MMKKKKKKPMTTMRILKLIMLPPLMRKLVRGNVERVFIPFRAFKKRRQGRQGSQKRKYKKNMVIAISRVLSLGKL